ncbi:MAG: alpha/beta hydrolase [Actinomyces sp.]|nr:MAG: alpha/beta hydrolase [Actinomyces sp.]
MGVKRPSLWNTVLELRTAPELLTFVAAAPVLLGVLPRGEGRHVLVLPGFTAGDTSTAALRGALRGLGHRPHGWGLGRNLGPTDEVLDGIVLRLDELVTRNGGPIDIVGWSLGGIYARELARLAPDHVRQVITLGSPFQVTGPESTNAAAAWRRVSDRHSTRAMVPRLPDHAREPVPVPTTAVYSRTDGVAHWSDCIDPPRARAENVEVRGSHCGLGHNPAVLLVIADRLAQADGQWRPFEPPAVARALFPEPTHLALGALA